MTAPAPRGFDSSDGADAVRFAARFGLVLDPWQADLCELWMRRTKPTRAEPDGRWCAGTWGISVPRQNGKNGTLEAVELYGMVVLGLRFIHTAHEVKTAKKHFRRMKHFFGEKRDDPNAKFPELNRLVKEIRSVNGEEKIVLFAPGSRDDGGSVEVIARSGGSGRGYTNDVLVIDEAQHLKDDELEAQRPAISAAPSGDPVAIYMGTPPKPEALSDEGRGSAFVRVRNGAVTGESKRAAWMEFGIEADLETLSDDEVRELAADRSLWVRTNPAIGRRLMLQTIEDELVEMGPRSFCRERLNVWPVPQKAGAGVLSVDRWRATVIEPAAVGAGWKLCSLGLDMDPAGRVWYAAGSYSDDGIVHVQLGTDDILAAGIDAAVERIWRACRKHLPVVMPSDSGASLLEAPLRQRGVLVFRLTVQEQAQASAGLAQALKDGALSHLDDPVLEQTVRESGRLVMPGGLWRLSRVGESASAPLLAVAAARHGAVRWAQRPSSGSSHSGRASGTRASGRRPSGRR